MFHLHSLPMVKQTAIVTREGRQRRQQKKCSDRYQQKHQVAKPEQTVQLQRVLHVMQCCIGERRWPMWSHAVDCVKASYDCAIDHGLLVCVWSGLDWHSWHLDRAIGSCKCIIANGQRH